MNTSRELRRSNGTRPAGVRPRHGTPVFRAAGSPPRRQIPRPRIAGHLRNHGDFEVASPDRQARVDPHRPVPQPTQGTSSGSSRASFMRSTRASRKADRTSDF